MINLNYKRRKTIPVRIGEVPLGDNYPIRIQSMANTPTSDTDESLAQCIRLSEAGAEYVRFAVPSLNDIPGIEVIRQKLRKKGFHTPIIADVHFNAEISLKAASVTDKVRINPGNFAGAGKPEGQNITEESFHRGFLEIREKFLPLIDICRQLGTALRIGVNHGSLSARILNRFGDTPEGMAQSAMEFLRICQEENFDQVVVSMKASNVRIMVYATRLIVKMMDLADMHYPLHLGVTEAGEGEDGRIKSAAGIGALLNEGIGDTIRVSLTEDPEFEIPVAQKLVRHVSELAMHKPLPDVKMQSADPYEFARRISKAVGNTGGRCVPVVLGESVEADYILIQTIQEGSMIRAEKNYIMPYLQWQECKFPNVFPLITAVQFFQGAHPDTAGFVLTDAQSIRQFFENRQPQYSSPVLIYECSNINIQAELRWLYSLLKEKECALPVIVGLQYSIENLEDLQVCAAADVGGTFIDGFGDGLWIRNKGAIQPESIVSTAFSILQSCRARITRTEYISCPSCGRTHFNLTNTLARIKEATSHLKTLKIGVMGCIVNGPGEMADADYGYVGAGKGRITLYKSRQVIKRGIPESSAVEELVSLIKAGGDWVDT